MSSIKIDHDTWLELSNLSDGTFSPLNSFMGEKDYRSVVDNMCLADRTVWPIPITLDLGKTPVKEIEGKSSVVLINENNLEVAEITISEIFETNPHHDVQQVFGTTAVGHPGVAKELSKSKFRIAGSISLFRKEESLFPEYAFSPEQTRKQFEEKGWTTVTGFQTRNPVHRAHEYLQRIAMEVTDGIFIQPLIGWKKGDDFSPLSIIRAYETLIDKFYPSERVVLGTLRTPMRYAGPREAVFHAIIRKNHGCTHFIVGRDHAGVGDYYGLYEAQNLALSIQNLGIEILPLSGPYYCSECQGPVTDRTCKHSDSVHKISGTRVRKFFSDGEYPPETFMRKEISEVLLILARENRLFVKDYLKEEI